MRNHRLRERRLQLGVSQYELGCLAGFPPASAQRRVSSIERNDRTGHGPASVRAVRSALVYLETEPRRRRAEARQEQADVEETERAIVAQPMDEARIVTRMVDLLFNGRGEDFDALAARVSEQFSEQAGNDYLDASTPSFPATNGAKL